MTKVNILESLRSRLNKCRSELNAIDHQAHERASSHFNASGGCTKCRGRGWTVTWDTMDSMTGCYHESESCSEENCTPESRAKSGLMPSNNKYDGFHDGSRWSHTYTDEEIAKRNILNTDLVHTGRELSIEEARWSLGKGKVVRVERAGRGPKARRVPVGVEGFVKHIHTNEWGGQKCLIVDAGGKEWWPSMKQVDVIDPKPDMTIWNNIDKDKRVKTGLPVIVTIKRKSAKAALIKTTRAAEFWIPMSQVPELKNASVGSVTSVDLPMWLAKKNNLC